jgi:hypothetical protein
MEEMGDEGMIGSVSKGMGTAEGGESEGSGSAAVGVDGVARLEEVRGPEVLRVGTIGRDGETAGG